MEMLEVSIHSFQSRESRQGYLDHLSKEEIKGYASKMQVLGTCESYETLAGLFQPLGTVKSLPELLFGNVYIYLVENPSPYTAEKMKAYKSTDSHLYFHCEWVDNAAVWEVKEKKFFTVKTNLRAKLAHINVTYLPNGDLGGHKIQSHSNQGSGAVTVCHKSNQKHFFILVKCQLGRPFLQFK